MATSLNDDNPCLPTATPAESADAPDATNCDGTTHENMSPSSPPDLPDINTFEKIEASMQILQQINSAHVLLSNLFLQPFYKNTALERRPFFGPNQQDSDDAILRKNIYFLAQNVKNLVSFVIQLVQRGLLSLDEKDSIMRYQEEYLKSLATFVYVIKKDARLFPRFLDSLKATGNDNIAIILERAQPVTPVSSFPLVEAASSVRFRLPLTSVKPLNTSQSSITPSNSTSLSNIAETQTIPETVDKTIYWICENCTFINKTGSICEMCAKSKDFKMASSNTSLECPQCTFINSSGVTTCEMCDFLIVPLELELNEAANDSNEEWP